MQRSSARFFHRFAVAASVVAFCLVVLGAYVRLSHAGLGCPDWPGCYGQLTVPQTVDEVAVANQAYPQRPVHEGKAWKEMIHRYLAGVLGLMVLVLAVLAWRRRRFDPRQSVVLPTALLTLVVLQALLGMWTVTLLLKPVVVMAHLLGGMLTLALLFWLALRTGGGSESVAAAWPRPYRAFALVALGVVTVQIALGGWTSANYAALACYDFPTCQGSWWPDADFGDAFVLWRGVGVDYEGGVLDSEARVAIHLSHRIGALLSFLIVGALAVALARSAGDGFVRSLGWLLGAVLLLQVALGIGNVLWSLPLTVATAHTAGGALLLLILVRVNHALRTS